MAKIKVNELEKLTPSDGDTLLASGAEKEYALKVEDLKDYIGGGEADWNASEGEKGYIKNRTHYTETVEDNIEWAFTLPENAQKPYYDNNPDSNLIDKIYNVYLADKDNNTGPTPPFLHEPILINGIESDCYFFYYKDNNVARLALLSSEDINNPNAMYLLLVKPLSAYPSTNLQIIYYSSKFNVGENTIKIPYTTENVVKLDPKYLPEMKSLSNIKDAENGGIIEGLVNGEEGQINVASGKYAHVEGGSTFINPDTGETGYSINQATGESSHAEGDSTTASGQVSHAEGAGVTASGMFSHAEGDHTTASGNISHAEGAGTTASGMFSHAEGGNTIASEQGSHAEGNVTTASGYTSHAEGHSTIANHAAQHVFGEYNVEDPSTANATVRGNYVEIVGNGNKLTRSNARTLDWNGNEVLAGKLTVGTQPTEDNDVATKKYVDENSGGLNNIKDAENGGVIEGLVNGGTGQINVASGLNAHAEGGGINHTPVGDFINNSQATGDWSHAEGSGTTASGKSSHAEGSGTKSFGMYSHAEGSGTTASEQGTHAEGLGTTASAQGSHAEGNGTTASGMVSHAEGWYATASGHNSHAEGDETIAKHKSQHVFGECNIEDPSTAGVESRGTYVEIVGNGNSDDARSNARTLDWSGNEWISGSISPDGGVILKSPNGTAFKLTVSDDGTLSATNANA